MCLINTQLIGVYSLRNFTIWKSNVLYNIRKYNHLLNLIFLKGTIKLLKNCLLCARHYVNLNNNLELGTKTWKGLVSQQVAGPGLSDIKVSVL